MATTEFTTAVDNSTEPTDELPAHLLRVQLADQYLIYTVIVLIMIGMGGATEISELKKAVRRPWGILICWLSQFVIMPLLAFGLAHAANLPAAYAIGLIVQCSSPGGSMSNVFAFYARGNVSLSVCLTTCSTVLAVGAMPLCLFLYGRSWTADAEFSVPYLIVIVSLIMILIPGALGLLLKWKLPKYIKKITNVCALVGTIGLLISIGLRAYVKPDVFTSSWEIWLIAILLPLFAAAVGFICSSIIRLPCSSRRTISIETGCQNVALALSVINTSFPAGVQRAEMQVISSLYGPIMAVELIVLVAGYRALYKAGRCQVCEYGDTPEDDDVEMVGQDSKTPKNATSPGDGSTNAQLDNGSTKAVTNGDTSGQTNYAFDDEKKN
ncbi:sodium-dependent organic anion transporter-like [Ptychodera flava]|uniref:sodium-dependent organic anion transporter-like n=1 Tax=Ptychodera flava TaxID=63121 RepID=UPI00396A0D6D